MTILDLNIGQNVGTEHLHTLESDLAAVAIVFPEFQVSRAYTRIADSGEHTSCIRLTGTKDVTPAIAGLIDYLCTLTQQEAIPCILDGAEGMFGPNAAAWGAFNADLWLAPVCDNIPTQCDDALHTLRHAALLADGIWQVVMHNNTLTGWFERTTDGTGGGLWFERNEADQLELIDYDGVFQLPAGVLIALRTAGVQADRSFE